MKRLNAGKMILLMLLFLSCLAGDGRGGEIKVTGGTWAVQDTTPENPLEDGNAQLGINLTLDKDSVNQLVKDALLSILKVELLVDGAMLALTPIVNTVFSDLLSDLGLGVIGIGGGDGGVGGAGGGGIALGAGSAGHLESGNFIGGTGTKLDTGDLTSLLGGVVDLSVGIAAGGGGGLTQGGGGYDLLGGDDDDDPDGLLSAGGGGGSLGITADEIDYSGAYTEVKDTTGADGTTFTVEDTGTLNIFGGSGAGGGLVNAGVITGLLDVGADGYTLIDLLDTALGLVLPAAGIKLENLLVPEAGAETIVASVTQDGGTVNVIGGFGGGGGLLLDSKGAYGGGSTVGTATITGGTMNVYGGAGGGANITTAIAMDGGGAGGGKVNGGSISGATSVLNIYSGADGGDVSSLLSALAIVLNPLSDDGNGGEGAGGRVTDFTVSGGATLNLYAGTKGGANANVQAKYNNSGSLTGDTSLATANNITNNGGTINLYGIQTKDGTYKLGGTQLTGSYKQTHENSLLVLAGGTYNITEDSDGDSKADGGYFTAGKIRSDIAGSILANAIFAVDADGVTEIITSTSGTGSTLLLIGSDIRTGAKLTIGSGVTLQNATNTDATVTLQNGGKLGGTYTQRNNGELVLVGATLTKATEEAAITIDGGYVRSSTSASKLDGFTFNNTVTTSAGASGDTNILTIANATVTAGTGNLVIGQNVLLDKTNQSSGTVTLMTGGSLGADYALQTGGTLALGAASGHTVNAGAEFAGGTIRTDVGAATLAGGTFSGGAANPVTLAEKTTGSTLTLSGATIANAAKLLLATNVTMGGGTTFAGAASIDTSGGAAMRTLDNATFSGGTVDVKATGGDLTLTHAHIGNSRLEINDNVTLSATAQSSGTVALMTGGEVGTGYTLQAGGTLSLAGGAAAHNLSAAALEGGTINAEVNGGNTTASATGAAITGDVAASADSGATLSLAVTDIAAGKILNLGKADQSTTGTVSLSIASHDSGEIVLNTGGSIAGAFSQATGGTLTLAGGTFTGGAFSGGDIKASGGDRTLTGATIAPGTVTLGANVVLDSANSTGTVKMTSGAKLSGTHTQTGAGTIDLAGTTFNNTTANAVTVSGGAVTSSAGTGALQNITFAGNVAAEKLDIIDATVTGNLTLGQSATLKETDHASGTVILDAGGALGAGYRLQTSGTLVLADTDTDAHNAGNATFQGGTILANAAASTLTGGTFSGDGTSVITLAEKTAGGTLTISGATIASTAKLLLATNVAMNNTFFAGGEVNASGGQRTLTGAAVTSGTVTIGPNVLLNGSANTGGTVKLASGAILSGTHAQSGTGAIDLAGTTFNNTTANAVTVKDGKVTSSAGTGTLQNITFDGSVIADKLNIIDAKLATGDNLTIGLGATLASTPHAAGTVTLDTGGLLGAGYSLQGGILALNKAESYSAANATIQNGTILSNAAANTLSTLTGATITGGNVTLGANVVLDTATNASGTITLNTGAKLSGTHTQTGTGTIDLAGTTFNNTTANAVTVSGGAVTSSTGAGALQNITFDGNVIAKNLNIIDATIAGSLTIGTGATLKETDHASGTVKLDAGGSLGDGYSLLGGILSLADTATDTHNAGAATLLHGTILSNAPASTLTGGTLSGDGTDSLTLDENITNSILTLSGMTIANTAKLIVTTGIKLLDTLFDKGEITLGIGGRLAGEYAQSGAAKLILNGGSTAGVDAGDKITLAGGSVDTAGTDKRILDNASFTGLVETLTTGGDLDITNATIGDGGNLTLNAGVTLVDGALSAATGAITLAGGALTGDYEQSNGTLNLKDSLTLVAAGSATAASGTFTGGVINYDPDAAASATLSGAIIDSAVTAISSVAGGTLTVTNVDIDATTGNLILGSNDSSLPTAGNVVLAMSNHASGTITLNKNSSLAAGAFTQETGGTLVLGGGSTALATVTLNGGRVETDTAAGSLSGATVTGSVTLDAGDGKLTLTGTTINGGGTNISLTAGENTVLDATTVMEGTLTLDGGALSGTYEQGANGHLVLAGGDTSAVTVTLNGGTVRSEGAEESITISEIVAGVGGITDSVTFSTKDSESFLTVGEATIDGDGTDITVTANANVTLRNTELVDGTIILNTDSKLSGLYEQRAGGTLILAGGTVDDDPDSGTALNIYGGTIQSNVDDARFDNATLAGEITLTTNGGTSKLTLTGSVIANGDSLTIGENVHMISSNVLGGTMTIDADSYLEGDYVQSGETGKLILAGGDTNGLNSAVFNDGIIDVQEDSTLRKTTFTNAVGIVMTDGKTLTIDTVTIADKGDITAETGITLNTVTMESGGKLTVDGGAIGVSYQQNGGNLVLNTDGFADGMSITLSGGTVLSNTAVSWGATTINRSTELSASTGNSLTITGAKIEGELTKITLGDRVTLKDTSLTEGTITLDGGSLGGAYYKQSGTGKLELTGGPVDGTTHIYSGGTIDAVKGGASTLDGATFDTKLTETLASGGTLLLTNAKINNGGILQIGENVTLRTATLNDGAGIVLGLNGSLDGAYMQNGGTLTLAGGKTDGADSLEFTGGTVLATAEAVLKDATFGGAVDLLSSGTGKLAVAGDTLTLNEKANLKLGLNATLSNATLTDNRIITLNKGGSLAGKYTQTGGTLVLNEGTAKGSLEDGAANTLTLSGGTVRALTQNAQLAGAKFTGTVELDVDAPGSSLGIIDSLIDGATAVLELVTGVTFRNSELKDGTLVLAGGGVAAATFSGGEIKATAKESVIENSDFTSTVALTATGADLTLRNIGIGESANLQLGENVSAESILLEGGAITLGAKSALTAGYGQSGGTLTIASADASVVAGSIFGGGEIISTTAGAVLDKASFIEKVLLDASTGGLKFSNALVTQNADIALTDNVVLDGGTLETGKLTLSGGEISGGYTQKSGTLTLNAGTVASAKMSLSGGTIAAEQTHEIFNAKILKSETGGDVSVSGTDTATLTMNAPEIDAGSLIAGENVDIVDADVMNSGFLAIQSDTTLRGATTLTARGAIRFADKTPGNRATIESLEGDGGILHFAVNTVTGEGDYYIVENSEGAHKFSVTGTGEGEIDLLQDMTDGAEYSLVDGEYDEDGALLVRNDLTSRPEDDGSRIWYLGRTAVALTQTAEGIGNAPAISLAQVTAGMDEMGRRFRTLRDAEAAARNAASSFTVVSEATDCGCGETPETEQETQTASKTALDTEWFPMLQMPPLFQVWAQSYTHHMAVDTYTKATMNMHGMDIGFERRFDAFTGGAVYAGLVAGGQWLNNLDMEQSYASDGQGNGKAFSLGAYGFWTNADGWYADLAAKHFWTDLDLTSYSVADTPIAYSPRRAAFAVSAEFGKRTYFGASNEWHVEPRVGLAGIWMKNDGFTTSDGQRARYGTTKSFQTTAAIAFGLTGEKFSPYAEAAVVHGFNGKTDILMGTTKMRNDPSGTRLRASLGARYAMTDNVTLSVDASYERGANYRDVNGSFGINFNW